MNPLRKAIRKAAGVVFPWPSKHERKTAIATAARNKNRAQAAAAKAQQVEAQIVRMAAENHLAEAIARQVWGEHR